MTSEQVKALGTPETKSGFNNVLMSSGKLPSWNAAKNYCDALKIAISNGAVVNSVDYSSYTPLEYGLAPVPDGCVPDGTNCSAYTGELTGWMDGPLVSCQVNNQTQCCAISRYKKQLLQNRELSYGDRQAICM